MVTSIETVIELKRPLFQLKHSVRKLLPIEVAIFWNVDWVMSEKPAIDVTSGADRHLDITFGLQVVRSLAGSLADGVLADAILIPPRPPI